MIRLEQLKNMAAALSEIRSQEQINEQYLEDFLLENFSDDEIESIAQLDEEDMQSFVETIGEDLDADELSAFLEEAVNDHQQLDELIGAAARLVGKGIKKAAYRMTTAGRADAAERKVKKIKTRQQNKARLQKAKAELQALKKTRREEMDPVGKEDDDVDNDGDVDSSDKYLKNRRKAITKAVTKESTDPIVPLGGGVKMRVNPNGSIILQDKDPSGEQQLVVFGEKQTKSLISLIKGRKSVKGFKLGGSIRATRESNGAMYIVDDSTPQGRQMIVLEPTAANSIPPIIHKRTGMSESTDLDENVYASDYNVGHEKSRFGGYRPHVTHKKTGKTLYLGQTTYKKPEHAEGHALAYLKGYQAMGERHADRKAREYENSNKQHVYKEEAELDEAFQPKWKVTIGSKTYTVTARNTAEADKKAMAMAKKEGNSGVSKGKIEKVSENVDEGKTPSSHRQGLIDKIKKSGVVKSGSMSKKPMKEKAESEAQAIAARIALKHKREGTKPEKGSASEQMMKMSEKDLEDFTKMKKGAPYKVEEATEPEGIADKESEGSKKFMMMHTTQIPNEVNTDEINRMNAEEIKASLQRKVSHRWNDQKIGDK